MRRLLIALVVLGVLAPAAAGAPAQPELVAPLAHEPRTDGERFLTFTRGPRDRSALQVLDTRTRERRSLPKDPRCRPPFSLTAAGRALLSCRRGGAFEEGDLLNLRTGAVAPLPGSVDGEPAAWTEVGRHWVWGEGWNTGRYFAVNWRTREQRVFPGGIGPAYDLDDPALPERRVCHDWQRRGDLGAYDEPYFLMPHRGTVRLLHCDGGRRVIWRGAEVSPSIAGTRVTWVVGGRLYGYDIRTRRRSVWRIPPTRELAEYPLEIHRTRLAAILAVTKTESCPKDCFQRTSALYVAWLGRRR